MTYPTLIRCVIALLALLTAGPVLAQSLAEPAGTDGEVRVPVEPGDSARAFCFEFIDRSHPYVAIGRDAHQVDVSGRQPVCISESGPDISIEGQQFLPRGHP